MRWDEMGEKDKHICKRFLTDKQREKQKIIEREISKANCEKRR